VVVIDYAVVQFNGGFGGMEKIIDVVAIVCRTLELKLVNYVGVNAKKKKKAH
jgi:hypothetical protein